MDETTVRKYALRTAEIYKRWTDSDQTRTRPVLRDIAAAIGMSPNSLSAALRGHSNVLPNTAEKLANVLKCSVDDIATPAAFTPVIPKTHRRVVAITFAMETELMGALNRKASETGRNRSAIVRDAVAAYLAS